MKAVVTYRGWPGHFICGSRCIFHLNTLIELGAIRIVVSTVGMMKNWHAPDAFNKDSFEEIGLNRYYETMVFEAERRGDFYDANVQRQVQFDAEWAYSSVSDEWRANKGHWSVVREIVDKLESDQPLNTMDGSAITSHNSRVKQGPKRAHAKRTS